MPYSKEKHKFREVKKWKSVWSEALGKMVKRPVKFSAFVPLTKHRGKLKKVV
jgi:hypothetical protein